MATPDWLVDDNGTTGDSPVASLSTPGWLIDDVGITGTEQWDVLPDTADVIGKKGKIVRSPMYTDSATGKSGERQFGQFIPSSKHVPLSESPAIKRKEYAAKLSAEPSYRKAMENFIRSEGARNYTREVLKDVPLAELLMDRWKGVYNDPIHPEKTTEKILGFQPTKGVIPSAVNAVYRTVADPVRPINNFVQGMTGLGANVLETAAGLDKEKTLGKLGPELWEPIKTSLGFADVEEAYKTGETDFTYPKAREVYENDLANTALIAAGTLKGGISAGQAAGRITKATFTPSVNQVKASLNLSKNLAEIMPRRGEGPKFTGKMDANRAKSEADGFNYLHDNPDILPPNELGEPIKATQLKTQTQFDALENGINKLLTEQDVAIKRAGGSGIEYKTQPLIDFWNDVINNTEKGTKGADIIKHARKEIESLMNKGPSYSLDGALNDLTILNNELRFGQMPISNSVKGVMGKEATLRRQLLDDAVMKTAENGDPYLSDIRRTMGSLLELRDRNGKLLSKLSKQNPSQLGAVAHDYGLAQIAYGIIAHNPAAVAKGGLLVAAKNLRDKWKSSDHRIQKMHEDYAKRRKISPKREYVTPTEPPLQLMPPNKQLPPGQQFQMGDAGDLQTPSGRDPKLLETREAQVPERGFQRAGIDYPIEGEIVNQQQIGRPQTPDGQVVAPEMRQIGWENDPALLDPRLTVDGAYKEWMSADTAGDKTTAQFWMDKYQAAVRKDAGIPEKGVISKIFNTDNAKKAGIVGAAYLATDEDNQGLPLVGAAMLTMGGKPFFSQLAKSLDDIVPTGKDIVGTPDVQLKGTPEKRFTLPDGSEKVIPAREGGLVAGKPVDQVLFEVAKKLGVKEAELNASGIKDALIGKNRVVNRELREGETGVVTVPQLKQLIEDKLPRLGEDVYGGKGNDGYGWQENNPGEWQVFNNATGEIVKTVGSMKEAEAFANQQPKAAEFSGYQAIKSGNPIPGSYTEKFVTVEVPEALQKDLNNYMRKRQDGIWEVKDSNGNWYSTGAKEYSFAREKVTEYHGIDGQGRQQWQDEHSQYSDTKNPMVRIRYDDVMRDGKKVRRLQEIQEPKEVNKASSFKQETGMQRAEEEYTSSMQFERTQIPWEEVPLAKKERWAKIHQERIDNEPKPPVSKDLATRAIDMGIKQLIADAKREGVDGIEWATGEQTRDLYDNALKQVADEARYNPETMELTIYKNGQVSGAQSQVPKKVTKEMLPEIIGKAGAERLLSSRLTNDISNMKDYELGNALELNNRDYYDSLGRQYQNPTRSDIGSDVRAILESENHPFKNEVETSVLGGVKKEHIATDLTIDATWPGKLYGDFVESGVKPESKVFELYDKAGDFVGEYTDLETVKKQANYLDGYFQTKIVPESSIKEGNFNYSATVPRLLKQYGKGEFGGLEKGKNAGSVFTDVNGKKLDAKQAKQSIMNGDDVLTPDGRLIENRTQLKEYMEEGISNQPVMWLTKDTPSEFPMYEGTTGIFRMLQDQIVKEGGGATGVKNVALKYGVPAGLIAKFLSSDDEGRKKILGMGAMIGLTTTLKPAVVRGGKVMSAPLGKTHYDVSKIEKGADVTGTDKSVGFITPEGKFLDRKQSLEWLKENEPDVYRKLDKTTREKGLESMAYAHAKGAGKSIDDMVNSFMRRQFGKQ